MPGPKPIVGRLSNRSGPTLPAVIGSCRLCPDPIRAGDQVVWIRQPRMGRAHRRCVAAAIEAGTPVLMAAQ
jgi:hypothetical protein